MNTVVARHALEARLAAISPWALIAGAIVAVAAASAVAMSQAAWIGKPFPGFFVLPNRVVASVGRPHWAGTRDGAIFQSLVVAVDGRPVAEARDVYDLARAEEGREVTYTLRDGAAVAVVAMPNQVFTRTDYLTVFGAYAATGLLYLLMGLLAIALSPSEIGRALLVLGAVAGVFALTGAGIYTPGSGLRLHALAESLFPAAVLQLALAFHFRSRAPSVPLTALGWILAVAIAVPYQLLLTEPTSYSVMHGCAETFLGVAGLVLAGRLVWEVAQAPRAASPLLRGAAAGSAIGLGIPAIVVVLSGLSGGQLPVNVVTGAAFAFPLCLVWGLLRERAALPAGAS